MSLIISDIAKIIEFSNKIRFVGIMNEMGNVMFSMSNAKITLNLKEEELFEVDLHVITGIQSVFDESLGKVNTMKIFREKVIQLIIYVNKVIIFVSCDANSSNEDISKIEEYIKKIIK